MNWPKEWENLDKQQKEEMFQRINEIIRKLFPEEFSLFLDGTFEYLEKALKIIKDGCSTSLAMRWHLFAEEVRRQILEEFYLWNEIDKEEETGILKNAPQHNPALRKKRESKWIALRLGKVIAEGMERKEVEEAVEKIQNIHPKLFAVVLEVGKDLPINYPRFRKSNT